MGCVGGRGRGKPRPYDVSVVAELLVPGTYRIDAIGLPSMVNDFAVAEGEGWTLVDTGIGGSPRRIQARCGGLP